ncbi:MAG: zinc-binding dehydrogenase [Eubacteriales bacterium]
MITSAVRLHGENDLRLDHFELPSIADDEILVRIISDSICMSSYKAAIQGSRHKRVPNDISEFPVIIGHEFAGEIVEVGEKWKKQFATGDRYAIQPALNYKGSMDSPGYSFRYCGGAATYCILPHQVMELGCLLPYDGDAFFLASLAEPMSCIIGAYHASFHTQAGIYQHIMGIRRGGRLAIIAGAGPMGLGAVDYALHGDIKPSQLIVTDISEERLERARSLFPAEREAAEGVELQFINTADMTDPAAELIALSGGQGFDDVFAFAPVSAVCELADRILGHDGCLNFFAGPIDSKFSAPLNYYNVHYNATHVIGTTGGNTDDMRESLALSSGHIINPAVMVTHVGGLDAAAEATLHLPQIPGGKKLIYTGISMPLTAIDEFAALGECNPMLAELSSICDRHNGLWNAEAEKYLLSHESPILK